jgi:hypothetical protein
MGRSSLNAEKTSHFCQADFKSIDAILPKMLFVEIRLIYP